MTTMTVYQSASLQNDNSFLYALTPFHMITICLRLYVCSWLQHDVGANAPIADKQILWINASFNLQQLWVIFSPEGVLPVRLVPTKVSHCGALAANLRSTHGFASFKYVPPSWPTIVPSLLLISTKLFFFCIFSASGASSFQSALKLNSARLCSQTG